MSEATSVGAIYFDMIVRGNLEKQIQDMAAKGKAIADKVFSEVEKTAESMANSITKQTTKPVEKLAETMAKSSEKMTDCFKKISVAPAEKALQKAQAQAEKTAAKVHELESAIAALDTAADAQIANEVKVFSDSVEAARKRVDSLTEKILVVKNEMATAPSQALSQTLGRLLGQYSLATEALKNEQAILNKQMDAAWERTSGKFRKQQEELYSQLTAAREKHAARVAEVAQQQSTAEITEAKKTTQAIQAERMKQAAVQTSPMSGNQNGMSGQSFIWQQMSGFAKSFGDEAVAAFSKANGSAVSFGEVAKQAFTKAGGAAGLLGGNIGIIITVVTTAAKLISSAISAIISKIKDGLAKAKEIFTKISTVVSKLTGNFNAAGGSARRFGSRLREIVSGALIFNGISAALRNMVSYMGESITASDSMKRALSNLKGAAANAASPLVQVLTPALTNLANAAATALTYVEKLLTRLTGKVSNAAEMAAKNAAKTAAKASQTTDKAVAAAKKAQRSLASFDEIERLEGNTETTADNGSPGAEDKGNDGIEPNYNFKGFSSFLDSILSAIENGKWAQVGELIAEKLNSILSKVEWDAIQEKVKTWTQHLVDTLNGFIDKIDWGLIGTTIGEGLNTITTAIDTFFQGIDWEGLGTNFAKGLSSLVETIDWERLGRTLTDGLRATLEWLHGFVTEYASSGGFSKLGTKVGEMLKSAFGNINWPQLAEDLNAGILGVLDTLIAFVQQIEWEKVGQTISECFEKFDWPTIGQKIGELLGNIDWGTILGSVWEIFTEIWKAKFETITSIVVEGVKQLGEKVVKHFKEVGLNGIQGFLQGIQNPVPTMASWIVWLGKHLINPMLEAIRSLLGIHSPSTVFAEIGENLVLGLLEGLEEAWAEITTFVDDVLEEVKETFSDAFEDLRDSLSGIWTSIVTLIRNAVNGVIGSINGMISGVVNGMNTVIRALNRVSFKIPDWLEYVPGASNIAGKTFGFNLQTMAVPQIPYLANGGVIQQPTLAMMGEYAGARNNPEIVTPQSLMAETVASVMEDVIASVIAGFERVVEEQQLMRQTVESIEVGDEVIGQAAERYVDKMRVVRGR